MYVFCKIVNCRYASEDEASFFLEYYFCAAEKTSTKEVEKEWKRRNNKNKVHLICWAHVQLSFSRVFAPSLRSTSQWLNDREDDLIMKLFFSEAPARWERESHTQLVTDSCGSNWPHVSYSLARPLSLTYVVVRTWLLPTIRNKFHIGRWDPSC